MNIIYWWNVWCIWTGKKGNEKKEELNGKVSKANERIEELESKTDRLKLYSRQNCILIHGIAENK